MFKAKTKYREEIADNNLWIPEGGVKVLQRLWRMEERSRSDIHTASADTESCKEQNIGEGE